MAQVKFTPASSVGRQRRFLAEFDPMGPDLPRRPRTNGQEQMELRPLEPGVFPAGTDNQTPGMTGDRSSRTVFSRR